MIGSCVASILRVAEGASDILIVKESDILSTFLPNRSSSMQNYSSVLAMNQCSFHSVTFYFLILASLMKCGLIPDLRLKAFLPDWKDLKIPNS